jgi:hypothetical protein
MRTATDSDHDREDSLSRDESREYRAPRPYTPRLTGRGTLQALLLERTEPDVNATAIQNAWRPSDEG